MDFQLEAHPFTKQLSCAAIKKQGSGDEKQTYFKSFELYPSVQLIPGAAPSTLLTKTQTKQKIGIKNKNKIPKAYSLSSNAASGAALHSSSLALI